MGKIAFVFSGQGAQYPGMGQSLAGFSPAAKAVFDLADSLRPGTSQQCFAGTAEELAHAAQKSGQDPEALCPACRQRQMADVFSQTYGG